MNAADVLERAADVIVERGWAQGKDVDLWGDDGPVCAAIAMPGGPHRVEAADAFRRFVGAGSSIAYWNDEPGRTADEVIVALRGCAAELRAAS